MSDTVLQKTEALFSGLNQPVYLLDRQGRCLVPKQPDTFMLPATLQENVLVSKSGYLFLTLPGYETYTLASKDKPESRDILVLCANLIQAFKQEQGITREISNALKRLLMNDLGASELDNLLGGQSLPAQQPRAVMLVSLAKAGQAIAREAVTEYIPVADEDLLIPLDARNIAVARTKSDDEQDDLLEYGMALQDTLQNELGLQAVIGIGSVVDNFRDLRLSYLQARQAIAIGGLFKPEAQIFDYNSLVLERFMMDCAPEPAAPYINMLFNKKTARLFNEEMLETVNVFINRDLNLTDAAKDLYIHRNTLVYRLDKIQKISGLDLRHFRDAMLFKLLNDLRKKAANQTKTPDDLPKGSV